MPQLNKIHVIHKTENKADADTDADFELIIWRSRGDEFLDFRGQSHDEREKGLVDAYEFDVSGLGIITGEQVVLGYRDPWPPNGWFDRNNNKYPDRYVISN